MKTHNIDIEIVKKLALATARPGTKFLTGYVNGQPFHYKNIEDALTDGREFLVYSRNDLEVFDLDRKFFKSLEDIEIVIKMLNEQKIKFVLVSSGTGFHLFVNLWTIPVEIGDIKKPNALKKAKEWIIEFSNKFPLQNYSKNELYRGERPTRTPLSPHRDKLPVGLIYPNTTDEAEKNLRYHGLLGNGVRNISDLAFSMIRGENKYATSGRSNTFYSLALSLVNYGYTYEDFEWIVLKSSNVIKERTLQRAKERKRNKEQVREELERSWKKAVTRCINRPPISTTRQEINNWFNKALTDLLVAKIASKTKIRLILLITDIGLRAYQANNLTFTRSIAKLHLDTQISERSINKYLKLVTNYCDLTISSDSHRKQLNIATTRFQLLSVKQDAVLTSEKLNALLKPNYSYINNGDNSGANTFTSQICNPNLYIDLGALLDIWHPHDAWFASKISGGLLGKLIWNLSQVMTEGSIEDLCKLLEQETHYLSKTIIPRMMQANLLEINSGKLKWIGDGDVLDSIALAGKVEGKQKKREEKIKQNQLDREKVFKERQQLWEKQQAQLTKDTLEAKFDTNLLQIDDSDVLQHFENFDAFDVF